MKTQQCPLCYTSLEVVECTPCHDCGHFEEQVATFKELGGEFNLYDVYEGLSLRLCNLCKVDFGSYKSDFLGFKDGTRIGFEHMHFLKAVENPQIEKDKYCSECNMRLKFLLFIRDLRAKISETKTTRN